MIARIVVFLLLGGASALAQAATPELSPELIERFKSLPEAQQRALARQYGISLPIAGGGPSSESYRLATPGAPLRAAEPPRRGSARGVEGLSEGGSGQDLPALPGAPGGIFAQGIPLVPGPLASAPAQDLSAEPRGSDGDDAPLERFGLGFFDQEVSTFAPTDDASVPLNYRLGTGDELVVQLFGKQNQQATLQIDRGGAINFPSLGPMLVNGLTFEEARRLIELRVQEGIIGAEVVVTLGRLRAINIFLAGEVRVPGAYSVSALTTVTQALYQAGGVSEIGSLRDIQVRRRGELVARFDSYDLLLNGDLSGDLTLQSGDVVFVPPFEAVVEMSGEVKRPALYELAGGETLRDVLAMAGGVSRRAFTGAALLRRRTEGSVGAVASTVDLKDPAVLATTLGNGDLLTVPALGEALDQSVKLSGAVVREGVYGWKPGMRFSDLVPSARGTLLEEADLGYAVIVRVEGLGQRRSVLQFEPQAAMAVPGSQADPRLEDRDEVLIFSRPSAATGAEASQSLEAAVFGASPFSRSALLAPLLETLRYQTTSEDPVAIVSIGGAVHAPGSYPLARGATLADLLRAGGGVKDSAFLESAELRRLEKVTGGKLGSSYRELDLRAVLVGDPAPELKSRDYLFIREIPDWSPEDSVTIRGEVAFPGTYLVEPGETLGDLLERAGGLTEEAFPRGAIFLREEVAERERAQAIKFAKEIREGFASRLLTEEATTQSMADIESIAATLETSVGRGRLLIDLEGIEAGRPGADFELQPNDSITIPKAASSVTIVGEVNYQGTHRYRDNLTLSDYIGLSAGLTARADSRGIYVIGADGSVRAPEASWWRFSGAGSQLAPGDTVVVPVNIRYKETLASWREITQILYQSLVSLAAVARL